METITIELTNHGSYIILKDLEELGVIRVVRKPKSLSLLRRKIQTKMSNEDIDKQLNTLRKEWQSVI